MNLAITPLSESDGGDGVVIPVVSCTPAGVDVVRVDTDSLLPPSVEVVIVASAVDAVICTVVVIVLLGTVSSSTTTVVDRMLGVDVCSVVVVVGFSTSEFVS